MADATRGIKSETFMIVLRLNTFDIEGGAADRRPGFLTE
jgi:hypothetical protein